MPTGIYEPWLEPSWPIQPITWTMGTEMVPARCPKTLEPEEVTYRCMGRKDHTDDHYHWLNSSGTQALVWKNEGANFIGGGTLSHSN